MSKKWFGSMFMAVFSLVILRTTAGAVTTNISEIEKMKAALCMHWECPSIFMEGTGLEKILAHFGRKSALASLAAAQEDAQYFAEKVIFTEPGNEPTQLYKNLQIRIMPGDRLTVSKGPKEVLLNTTGQRFFNVHNYQAHLLKINGRRLITRNLHAAHQATQQLIKEGAITPPLNEFASATNARLLNKSLLVK